MNLLMELLEKYQHLLVWMGIGSVFVFIISLLSLPR
jgi:hypothetical protein